MGSIGLTFLGILLFATSLFMMLLILVQRGKGGGLTGALGGMGGQSAFGSKAGDVFTKITVVTAVIWIMLCMVTIAAYNPPPKDTLSSQKENNSAGSMISTDEEGEDSGSGDSTGSTEGSATSGDAPAAETDMDNSEVDEELENLIEDVNDAPADEDAEMSDDPGPSLDGNESAAAEGDDNN